MNLARLLDCSEEDLCVEVNQFFVNTWQRHGNLIRPDAPCKAPMCIRPSSPDTAKCTVEQKQELCSSDASTVRHTDVGKSHACQLSSGISSQIAWAHSSPELIDIHSEPTSRIRLEDNGNYHVASTRRDSVNRNLNGSEALGNLTTSLLSDRTSSSCSGFDYAPDSEVSSRSYQMSFLDDHTFRHASKEQFSSSMGVEGTIDEVYDRTITMGSSMFHGFSGHSHLPLNMSSSYPSYAVPPSTIASSSNNQKYVGVNAPVVENPWAPNMQFTAFPSAVINCFHGAGLSSSNSDMSETVNEGMDSAEGNSWEVANQVRHDHDSSSNGSFDLDDRPSEVPFDDRQPSVASHHVQQKHESFRQNTFNLHYQTNVENEAEQTNNFKTWPSACNTKLGCETSGIPSEGAAGKVSKLTKEIRGKKTAQSAMESAGYERTKTVSEQSFTQPGDRNEHPVYPMRGQKYQLPLVELSLTSGMDATINQVSGQRATENPGVPPFRFIPTGPPVPFLTMLTVYSVTNETGRIGKPNTRISENEEPDMSESNQKLDQSHLSPIINNRIGDIFDSDFLTHWQNLLYARSCQSSQNNQGPVYLSQFTDLPPYHFPSGGQGRTISGNMNLYTSFTGGGRCYPVAAPVTSMPSRPANVYQPFAEELPRYHGTGTYLPNPKVNIRDRRVSRNRRLNYGYDRNDNQNDREGNGNHIKPRVTGLNHIRNQYEEIGPWGGSNGRSDSQFTHHSPASSQSGSADVAYDTYSLPACSTDGVSPSLASVPSLVMMYPYGQKVGHIPHPQVLEFGSLGPVELSGMNGFSLVNDATRTTRAPEVPK